MCRVRRQEDVYLRFFGQYLEGFPIRTIDFTSPADVARHDRMVALVERMLDLHKKLRPRGRRTSRPCFSARSKPRIGRSIGWCMSCTG